MGDWGLDIPLVGPPNANVDEVHLDQSAAAIIDLIPVIVEGKIHLIKRAGLEVFADLSVSDNEPVNGLYWYDRGRSVIAVCGNKVIEIIDSLGNARNLLGSSVHALVMGSTKCHLSQMPACRGSSAAIARGNPADPPHD